MDTLQLIEQAISLLEQAEAQSGWATHESFAIQSAHDAAKRAREHMKASEHAEQNDVCNVPQCSKPDGVIEGCDLPF
jgi:hypothetical protein